MQARFFLAILAAVILTEINPAIAQQPGDIPRVGFLSGAGDPSNPGPAVEAFRQGLWDRGYIQSKNILVEYRYAAGKRERVQTCRLLCRPNS